MIIFKYFESILSIFQKVVDFLFRMNYCYYMNKIKYFHEKLIQSGELADKLAETTFSDSSPEAKNDLKQARRLETMYRRKLMKMYDGDMNKFNKNHMIAMESRFQEARSFVLAISKAKGV